MDLIQFFQRPLIRFVSAGAFALTALAMSSPSRAADLGYNRDILPILSDNCFACHGPDRAKRQAKLRLDDRDSVLERKVIDLKQPDQSEILKRIFSNDPKVKMPPPDSNRSLTDAQRLTLKLWIEQGTKYEPHWSYIPPVRPAVPNVHDTAWVRNPIDAFVLGMLEKKGISPSPPADRRTLLRRLSLDLIGLPPTPAEMQAFLTDDSPDAYEKQVDRLLASPHYGERMAVPWLDAVRFADTVGYHGDQNIDVFPYRDYVIDSFNRNKPFDQFTIEQLAGDLLPHPTTEQLVATAFNRLNMVTREGGAQEREYLAKYMADRVRTIGSTWLGSTLNCCECHDHKYDPFTARDFYSMGAFFADIKQWGVYADYGYTPNRDLAGFGNDDPFPPEIVVDSPYLKRRQARLTRQLDQAVALSAAGMDSAAKAEFKNWCDATAEFLHEHPDGWVPLLAPQLPLRRVSAQATVDEPVMTDEGAVLFPAMEPPRGRRPARAVATDRIDFALEPGRVAAVRVQLLPTELHHGSIIRDGVAGAEVRISASLKPAVGPARKIGFYYADADLKDDRYSNGSPVLGIVNAWRTSKEYSHSPQTAVFVLDQPFVAAAGDQLTLSFNRNGPGCVRVAVSPVAPLNPIDPSLTESLARAFDPAVRKIADQDPLVRRTYLLSTAWDSAALADVRKLHHEILECRGGKAPVVVTQTVPPAVTRLLPRGNWQDQSGPILLPATPHFLPQLASDEPRLTRLDLAKWLVSPQNPLTARVYVNRLWKQFFGAGLSNTVEDLGTQGEWPSHPELLDWLAVEFRESGWDVKHMVRLMVTSNVYRQDSNLPPRLRQIDPGDRLLAAQMPRRLEAEFIRDNALAIAGLLDPEIGGPVAFPYQPAGYYANIQFPDRKYIPDTDERQWRRGLYMHWQRTFLHPMLANFDAPSREDGVCTRNISNTPQQALTLLNDPEFVEAARVLAGHVLQGESDDDDSRLETIYQRALCRSPEPRERTSLMEFLSTQRDWYRSHPDDANKLIHTGIAPVPSGLNAGELAAWTGVCRVVLNLHETITRF